MRGRLAPWPGLIDGRATAAPRQQLGKVQRLLMTQLLDLFAAAESVCQQNRHGTRRFDRGEQSIIGNLF